MTARKRPLSTRRFLDWFQQQGAYVDKSGRAMVKLYEDAHAAGVFAGGPRALTPLMSKLEADGLVERHIRGKRTFGVRYTGPDEPWLSDAERGVEPEPVADPEPEPPAPAQAEPETDPRTYLPPSTGAMLSGEIHRLEKELEHAQQGQPLVARVQLHLELDPAMARLVLDLVERGDGVMPIDRAEVKTVVADAVNKSTERYGRGYEVLGDRIKAIEEHIAGLSLAMRQLGTVAPANGNGTKRAVRPDFKKLGVKDSELRVLLTDLALDGYTLSKTAGGHIRATKPGAEALTLPCTPSDHRGVKNARAQARILGAAV